MFVQLTILALAGLTGPLLGLLGRGFVPVIIGELIAGVALGRTGAGVIDSSAQPLVAFSALGFAMLMLTAGTRVDIGSSSLRRGIARGLAAFAVVAMLSVPLAVLIGNGLGMGMGNPGLLAVLISGSSAAIVFPIFEERRLGGDATSILIAWIGVADAVTVVLMPLMLASSANIGTAIAGDAAIVATGGAVLLLTGRLRPLRPSRELVEHSRTSGWAVQARLAILMLVGLSAIAERTGASTLVAGFLAGMVLVRLGEPDRLAVQLTGLANGFFVPLFFVQLGARIDLRALVTSPSRLTLAFALAGAAVVTHLVAARLASRGQYIAGGLAASAQLGLPAAAASIGLANGMLSPAESAALVGAGCLTLLPAALGARTLSQQRGAAST